MREHLNEAANIIDTLVTMGENNLGALNTLTNIVNSKGQEGIKIVRQLDDMNIRSIQVWAGYKGYCEEDFDKFLECIATRDADMISYINKNGITRGYKDKAIESGAAQMQERPVLNF